MSGGLSSVGYIAGAVGAVLAFVGIVFLANVMLSPRKPSDAKLMPYECGMDPAGEPWTRLPVRYSAIALLFVLFDAESVLLFAVASGVKGSPTGAVAVAAFALLLAFGLAWAWKKGALEWRA